MVVKESEPSVSQRKGRRVDECQRRVKVDVRQIGDDWNAIFNCSRDHV